MRKKFVRFSDTEAASCRWSEYADELFGDWDIVWENSNADYQGSAEFLAHKDGKFGYISWSYGSCSGCDQWEDMPADSVRQDFKNMAEYFEDVHALKKFTDQVNYGNGFKEAVEDYMLTALIEEELMKD